MSVSSSPPNSMHSPPSHPAPMPRRSAMKQTSSVDSPISSPFNEPNALPLTSSSPPADLSPPGTS
ncbi:hypothetical protein GYMLUDRAFT_43734, partial [Collybiopsis luxurians FD-317 M1]